MKNYLLFIIDSLNYSHVQQSEVELMPFLNKVAGESVICKNMFSQAPYTEAAVMNIYCGQNVLDHGGYLKRFKDTPNTLFEMMQKAGYTTYYNSFQPQCYPSSLRRGVDDLFYNVGFDLGALWSYRLDHYSMVLKNNDLKEKDIENLIEIVEDNFEEWIIFLNNYIKEDDSLKMIQNNSSNYDPNQVLELVNKQYDEFKKSSESYVMDMLRQGRSHPLFAIPAFVQNSKVKNQEVINELPRLFKPLMKEIRRKDFCSNVRIKKLFSGMNHKFAQFAKKPSKATWKLFLKSAYLVVDVLIDLDLNQRINSEFDSFKSAPSARNHIDHYINWAKNKKDEKYFACVHVDDIHNPEIFFTYDSEDMDLLKKEKKSAEELIKKLPKSYKGSITHDLSLNYIDGVIEYLFNQMKENDLLEDTCILITADHGFSFSGNPIRDSFVINLFLENYNIPCVIYNSGKKPEVVTKLCTSKDIPITLCDLAGADIPKSFSGHSIFEEHEYENVFIEYCGGGCPDLDRRELKIAAFDKNWFVGSLCSLNDEFSFDKVTEIYDLQTDPYQMHNCRKDHLDISKFQNLVDAIDVRWNKIKNKIVEE